MKEAWLDHIPEMQVYDICLAYESGFGHGIHNDHLPNPYRAGTPSCQAYEIGYQCGYSRLTSYPAPIGAA